MAKLSLTDIVAGYLSSAIFNSNNTVLEETLENSLSRDGTSPNSMESQLDMNGYRLTNLPDAVNNQEPVTLGQAATLASVTSPLTQDTVGDALYPEVGAETSASATVTNNYYPPGDIRRYGAAIGTADNTTAIQDAINSAGHGRFRVYIPGESGDRYRHATTLYCYYDVTNNPNFPVGARQDGRIIIEGDGAPYATNFDNTEYQGSILEYTGATGVGLDIYDSSGTEARNVVLRDFGVYGNTSGYVVQAHYVPTIYANNVFIGNLGTGGALSVEDSWTSVWVKVVTRCDGTNGTAFRVDAIDAGGGNHYFLNCVAAQGDIGFDFGHAYDAGNGNFMKNIVVDTCESSNNVSRNYRFRSGVGSATIRNCWAEAASASTGANMEFSNQCGFSGVAAADPLGIHVIDCNLSWSSAGSGYVGMQIGDSTGTTTLDAVGNMLVEGVRFRTLSATDALRRHNDVNNKTLIVRNCYFTNTAGQMIVIDDEAQYGPMKVFDMEADGAALGSWVEETGGGDRSYWLADFNQFLPELISNASAYDYSNSPVLPPKLAIRCNLAAGVTITAPTTPTDHVTTFYKVDGTNTFTLDRNGENVNGAASDFTDTTAWTVIQAGYDTVRGWIVA